MFEAGETTGNYRFASAELNVARKITKSQIDISKFDPMVRCSASIIAQSSVVG